jgi:hypothetical protein
MRITEINFNDYIYVKLTDAGIRRLINNHNEMVEANGGYDNAPDVLRVLKLPEPVEGTNGLVKMQFWHAMHDFHGDDQPIPFECDFQFVRVHILKEGHDLMANAGFSPPQEDAMKHVTWEIYDFIRVMGGFFDGFAKPIHHQLFLCHND